VSPLEARLLRVFQRRAATMSPDLAASILSAYRQIILAIESGNIEQAIRAGQYLENLDKALADPVFTKVRQEIRHGLQQAIRYSTADLPNGGRVGGQIAVGFDFLNPLHLEAVRDLETRVITGLRSEVRDVVRAHVENGLRDGVGPRVVARGIRDVVGLAPNQLEAVANFRLALEEGRIGDALGYKLRDKRFGIKKEMSQAQIDKAVDAYRRRFIAHHAETVARTATLDTLKKGQQLAQEDAVRRGILDPSRLYKMWIGVMDDRERESHRAMEHESVPYNIPYSNGQMIPGEDEYNCRCLSRFYERRAA
jgi:hypothetical protein